MIATLTAEEYKASLPRQKSGHKGVLWTIDTFATYVSLLYPHVTLKAGQVWSGNRAKYNFVCDRHGEYKARPVNILASTSGCQCKQCRSDYNSSLAGKRRSPHATPGEKQKAAELYAQCGNYSEVARQIGRTHITIRRWLDPIYAEKGRQLNARWLSNNRERQRASQRRYSTFDHGKANRCAHTSKRRALMWDAIDTILIDGEWYEVDMSQYLQDWDDRQMFVDWQSCQDYAQLQATCKELEEIHGEKFEVDHLVCISSGGLHCTENFQIKPAAVNRSKGCKRIPADDALFCKRIFNIN